MQVTKFLIFINLKKEKMKVLKIRNTHYGDEYYWEHTRHTIYATDGKNHETIELQDGQEFDSSKLAFKPTKIVVEAVTRVITPDDQGDQKPQTTVYQ